MQERLAPICVFAFNRPSALRRLLGDLQACALIERTRVYVFVDGARAACAGEAETVRQVCAVAEEWARGRLCSVVASPVNRGLAVSVIDGVSRVIGEHGRAIVLEDDLRLRPNLLVYMNAMLDAYESVSEVFQVSAFGLSVRPPRGYEADVWLSVRPSSWGWGTWADRWQTVDWQVRDYAALRSPWVRWRFNRGGSDMAGMLRDWRRGRNQSWAIRFAWAMFRQGRYAVTPLRSLTLNEGFGADATNCRAENRYVCSPDEGVRTEWRLCYRAEVRLGRQAAYYYGLWQRFLHGERLRSAKARLRAALDCFRR